MDDRDRPLERCVPPAGGSGGDHRRLRRRPPRPSCPARRARRPGPAADGLATVVVTFDRHPATVVRPESAPLLLCDLDQKLELLERPGWTGPWWCPSTRSGPTRRPRSSCRGAGRAPRGAPGGGGRGLPLRPRAQGQRGAVEEMGDDGRVRGGRGVPPGGRVREARRRSSRSRRPGCAARSPPGRVEEAAALLGPAPPGPGRGGPRRSPGRRRAGFPDRQRRRARGASACRRRASTPAWYERPDGRHPWEAAISVGRRPTFYGSEATCWSRPYLLDFSGDLYGEEARVSFVSRLRDEMAFDTIRRALIEQMNRDVGVDPGEAGIPAELSRSCWRRGRFERSSWSLIAGRRAARPGARA